MNHAALTYKSTVFAPRKRQQRSNILVTKWLLFLFSPSLEPKKLKEGSNLPPPFERKDESVCWQENLLQTTTTISTGIILPLSLSLCHKHTGTRTYSLLLSRTQTILLSSFLVLAFSHQTWHIAQLSLLHTWYSGHRLWNYSFSFSLSPLLLLPPFLTHTLSPTPSPPFHSLSLSLTLSPDFYF